MTDALINNPMAERATRVTQIIRKNDGSEVKIVAHASEWSEKDVHVEFYRRQTPDSTWVRLGDKPHPDWRAMPIDRYLKEGRPEFLYHVSYARVMQVVQMLHKPMSQFYSTQEEMDQVLDAADSDLQCPESSGYKGYVRPRM